LSSHYYIVQYYRAHVFETLRISQNTLYNDDSWKERFCWRI